MRGLLTLVVAMGVLIVAGVATIGLTIVRRLSLPPTQVAAPLNEPAGTHLQTITQAGDRLAILLSGGGQDRILLIDPHTGQVTGRISLAP